VPVALSGVGGQPLLTVHASQEHKPESMAAMTIGDSGTKVLPIARIDTKGAKTTASPTAPPNSIF